MTLVVQLQDAWGLSNLSFLAGYAALALAGAGFALAVAWRGPAETPGPPDSADRLDPYHVAYVRGGAAAAVTAAVAALHARKAVGMLRGGRVAATGESPTTRVKPLEYAVLRALRSPTTLGSLRSATPVPDEVRTIDRRLAADGLVPSAPRRRLLWSAAGVLVALVVLGLARLVLTPEGYLVGAVVGFGIVAAALLTRIRRLARRTAAGDTLLATLRERHRDLDPAGQNAWVPRQPEPAAIAVALFGAGAMPPDTAGRSGAGTRTAVDGSAAGGLG